MGGAELDMYTTAISLKDFFDVSVITGDWGQDNIENRNGILVYKSFLLKRGFLNYVKAPFILWKSMRSIDADIYISSGAGPEVGIIAFFCKFNKRKSIYRTAHTIDCDGSYAKKSGLSGMIYEYGLNRADKIVTSVRQHQELLTERYPELIGKVTHINLGIFPQDSNATREYVLWVARCEKWKRPEIFLDIVAANQDVSFLMICPKQKHAEVYFYEIKERAKFFSNLIFIDFVPFRNIQAYFDKAKVFVNTSDFEGFTYTLIQSGLARTPVVYLNVNPDEVITKNRLGYVAGGDKEEMSDQIRILLDDEKDWSEKSENIFEYANKNHDIVIVGKKWKEVLEELL